MRCDTIEIWRNIVPGMGGWACSIHDARAFDGLQRSDRWTLPVNGHSLHTPALGPFGRSPASFQNRCAIDRVIG